ncbi:MAG: xylulokinase [Anaerolineae bacterium]
MVTSGPLLLALDLGISSIKAAVFRPDGRLVALRDVEHLRLPEGEALAEFDPEVYWQGIVAAVRGVLGPDRAAAVAAMSISSHGETLFCLGADGRPTRPAILTLDGRAAAEASEIATRFGESVFAVTGQPEVLAIWPAAKIAWLRRHEPEVFAATARYLLPQGYALWRLTGRYADDPAVMTTSLMVDITRLEYWDEMLAFLGIDRPQLPELLPPGTVVGEMGRQAAEETGLLPGTPVVMGALDQLCGALGAGIVRPGHVSECTGTVLALVATTTAPVLTPGSTAPCYPHAVPGLYCLLPWHMTGGLALKWFRDRFAPGESYAALVAEAASVPAGAEGLLALPHLEGTQFPRANQAARGVFFGAGLRHGRGHFVRAILEATAFTLRQDLEALGAMGVTTDEIASFGGGARSMLWLQIKADVCGLPVRTQESEQTALLGAATLAAAGVGLHRNVPAAAAAMVRQSYRYLPDALVTAAYDRQYARYRRLSETVEPLF